MKDPVDEVGKRSMVVTRREAYEPFFDFAWFNELEALTKSNLDLARIWFDLAMSWRGASNTHYLPAKTADLLQLFATNHTPYGKEFKELFTKGLMEKIHKSLSNMRRKEVQKAIEQRCDEIGQELEITFDGETFWQEDYVKNSEIRFTIIASQRMCYCAIYEAYENFILRLYQLMPGSVDCRINKAKEFRKALAAVFGDDLCKTCWSDPNIILAGLARNALVHNGGRVTPELEKANHGFSVEDGEIQITPIETKGLHDLLKDPVAKLVKEAIAKLPKDTEAP